MCDRSYFFLWISPPIFRGMSQRAQNIGLCLKFYIAIYRIYHVVPNFCYLTKHTSSTYFAFAFKYGLKGVINCISILYCSLRSIYVIKCFFFYENITVRSMYLAQYCLLVSVFLENVWNCALFVNKSTVLKWTKDQVLTDAVWIFITSKVRPLFPNVGIRMKAYTVFFHNFALYSVLLSSEPSL